MLLGLPDELWSVCVLRNGRQGEAGERVSASELVRMRRVSHDAKRIVCQSQFNATVERERIRREKSQREDRDKRRRSMNIMKPPAIVLAAFHGDTAAVLSHNVT